MLDKSHTCASMYLSIILDRARYSPPRGDLDHRWDHMEDFLASCGRLGVKSLLRCLKSLGVYICIKTALWALTE